MRPEPKLASLSDLDLLEQLCSSDQDDVLYKEFVSRFLPDLKEECKKKCDVQGLDRHVGNQVTHDVFERVRRYKSFKRDRIRLPNDRRAILVYLFRIATRLFTNYHSQEKKAEEEDHRTYFDDLQDETRSIIEAKSLKNKKQITEALLKKLNPKERAVLIADAEHKRHQKYLPDDTIMELSHQLSVTPATIRKIRERAKEKLKKAIDEINQA